MSSNVMHASWLIGGEEVTVKVEMRTRWRGLVPVEAEAAPELSCYLVTVRTPLPGQPCPARIVVFADSDAYALQGALDALDDRLADVEDAERIDDVDATVEELPCVGAPR